MTNICQAVAEGRVVGGRRTRRIYSHAVVAVQIATRTLPDGTRTARPGEWRHQEPRLVALSFHRRLDLAQRAAAEWIGHEALEPGTVRIVETTIVECRPGVPSPR